MSSYAEQCIDQRRLLLTSHYLTRLIARRACRYLSSTEAAWLDESIQKLQADEAFLKSAIQARQMSATEIDNRTSG